MGKDSPDSGFLEPNTAKDVVDLSIIIVSWNVLELLQACLSSIQEHQAGLNIEVIVVDGGSVDGSPEMVRTRFPAVTLLAEEENVGFPRGNNIGMGQASGRHFLLLNPDTEVLDNALWEMVNFLDYLPEVGVVGPQLINPDGSVQSSRRRFPSLVTGIFESTWLEPFAPKSLLRRYYAEDLPDDATVDVDWLVGACLLVRRHVVEKVGLMDEGYFMYSEELDWCRRIKRSGWRVVYYPEAKVIHHLGKSSEQAVTERHINFQRAKLRYFRLHHGRNSALVLRLVLLVNYVWQICLEAIKGLAGHKRSMRRQRVKAYWKVLKSGLRPAGY